MDLDNRLENIAVVGAAGKMGSGIALLLALDLAYRGLAQKGRKYVLNLIDMNDQALQGLLQYLRDQAVKDGERQINRLRTLYQDRPDLVENGEIIQAFVQDLLGNLRTGTSLSLAKDAHLVFEAAFEKEEIKFSIYNELAALCPRDTFFLTNTSSIPLHVLTEACGIQGRMIGFHFYNPPAVQRLLEVIQPAVCDPALVSLAGEVATLLGKRTVPSADVAGFIGNGHFIRDGLFALREAEKLAGTHGFLKAVCMVDRVSRDHLLRPMGIFQLIDYVGIDVFQLILRVMEKYLQEGLHSPLVDRFLEMGVRGGQLSSGAQRNGFLQYEKGRPVGIFNPETETYASLSEPWAQEAEALLGPLPDPAITWKALSKDPDRDAKLKAHFAAFQGREDLGIRMARKHLQASREIGLGLWRRGVAKDPQDVNEVLKLGFFHLYGPINDFLPEA